MSGRIHVAESPVTLLFGHNGTSYIETTIRPGVAVPSGQPGLMALGHDGTVARYLKVDPDGTLNVNATIEVGAISASLISEGIVATAPPTGALQAGGTVSTAAPSYTDGLLYPLSLTTTGLLRVDGSGVTQPVSIASSVAVTGPLTDTQLRATAVPISAASLPLPSGAATEATAAGLLTTAAFQARVNTLGQKTMANSTPVVVASDQSNLPTNLAQVNGTTVVEGGVAGSQGVGGLAAAGSPVAGKPVLVAGSDGTNARSLALDSNGMVSIISLPEAIARGRIAGDNNNVSGHITTGATKKVLISSTTHVEQTSGAQRSIVSTSANDTSGGTGARTVKITYHTFIAGVVSLELTETLTLNGTTPVDTVATDIYFVTKVEVITVGSTGSNVGTINLYTATAGGGSVFASIAPTANQTYTAHHYIPTGRKGLIYNFWFQNDAAAGNTPKFTVEILDLSISNGAEKPILWGRLSGLTTSTIGSSGVPMVVAGPARIRIYVTPQNTASQESTVDLKLVEI